MKTQKQIQSGSVDIKLTKGISIDGTTINSLRMREPTVGDQIAMSKSSEDAAEQEIFLFGNLCSVAPADMQQLTLRDYKAVQEAFKAFVD